jgi:tetratricopeptide (TPR) repeat protein
MSMAAHRLGSRALAAVARRLALPLEVWLSGGDYSPFVAAFSRNCDAAQAWIALAHSPESAPRLDLDGVEMRGSREERQAWSVLWSLSRVMEFARCGENHHALLQLEHSLQLVRDWPAQMRDAADVLLGQAEAYIPSAPANVPVGQDPPIDGDALTVPHFYEHDPAPWDSSPRRPSLSLHAFSFDEEVDELVTLLRDGKVAVFCGSGISIGSGIPDAESLRRELLAQLPASAREVRWLMQCGLPFEAFLETLLETVELGPLRQVFIGERPGNGHVLLARLAKLGRLDTIVTTNFDELIETALVEDKVVYSVASRDDELIDLASRRFGVRLFKLHGTVTKPEILGVSMEAVAGLKHLEGRDKAIAEIFADGAHEAVLLLGYSCSDSFDVSPAIKALGDRVKRVFLVDHSEDGRCAEDIRAATRKNPFGSCTRGVRLTCNTDVLLGRLAAETLDCRLPAAHTAGSLDWKRRVAQWWDQVGSSQRSRVGHSILGALWYRSGDYRAAKAHEQMVLASVTPQIVFHDPLGVGEHILFISPVASPEAQVGTLIRLGGCHRALSEYGEALRRFEQAEAVVLRHGRDEEILATIAGSLGTVHFNRGAFDEAVRYHDRARQAWEKLGDQGHRLGPCLANLGNAYGAAGKLDEALECHRRGVALALAIGDKVGEGSRLGGLATVHRLRGELDEARQAHRSSLAIAESMCDRAGIAHQLGGLSLVEEALGNLAEAMLVSVQALRHFEALGDVQGQARLFGNIGWFLLRSGQVGSGAEALLHAAELAVAIGDGGVLGSAVGHLGRVIEWAAGRQAKPADLERAKLVLSSIATARPAEINELRRVVQRLLEQAGADDTGDRSPEG